mgnify:CR=1 FL=1
MEKRGRAAGEPGRTREAIDVKEEGRTLDDPKPIWKDVVEDGKQGVKMVVVHGGGEDDCQWMLSQGIPPRFVNGLRVTDAASLEIVVAVLTGLINKELVSSLHRLGGRAIGISGIDGGLLEARIVNPELGFVGEINRVNGEPLQAILEGGYIPMIAPLASHCDDGSENSGSPLNINGDTVAGELAYALEAERLVFLTDVEGILDGSNRLISRLDRRRANLLCRSGVVRGGMIPTLSACLRALGRTPIANVVDGRRPEALLDCLRGVSTGTTIIGEG